MQTDGLKRLSPVQLLAISFPALISSGFLVPMAVFMPSFLSEHVGLSLSAVGIIILTARAWNVFGDPIMGVLTDATHTLIGRRRPWLLAGTPIVMLGTWQIYFAQPGLGFDRCLLWMIVLYAGWSMINVSHGAWGMEISPDYDERSRIFGAKTIAVAVAVPIFGIGPAILERTVGATSAQQIALIGDCVLIGLPVAIASLLWFLPERTATNTKLRVLSFLDSYLILFNSPAFMQISAAYFFIGLAEAAGNSLFLFLLRDGLALPNWTASFLVMQAVVSIMSLPLWLIVAKRSDKRIALIGVFIVMALVAPTPLLLAKGDVFGFALYAGAKGLSWGAEYTLMRAIVADLVDGDAARGGAHRAGQFFASFNLTFGISQAVGSASALWILAWFGFDPHLDALSRATHAPILRWASAAIPALCALACLFLILRFRFRREDLSSAQQALGLNG